MADPGEGTGWPDPSPHIFRKNRGPKGRKNLAPTSPLSKGLDPPLPPDEKLEGMGTTCLLHRFVQSWILYRDNEWSLLPRFILNVERRARDSTVKAKYSSKVHFQRYPTYQFVKSVTWDHYRRPMTLTNPRWFSLNRDFKILRRDNFWYLSLPFARLRRENA